MISIIISAFDNTQYIEQCLNSVVESCEGVEYEILLGVDNCKKTIEYIDSIQKKISQKIRIFFFVKNVGTYVVRNSLANIAKFDKLLFFDSDDVMRKIFVPKVIDELNFSDMVQYGYYSFNGDLKFSTSEEIRIHGTTPHVGSFGINKKIFLETNGFEPWTCAADGEFVTRMRESKKKIKFIPKVFLFYRKHTNNLTSNPLTGMSSPLRKYYHRLRELKLKNKNFNPLEKLETFDFIEFKNNIDDIKKYYPIPNKFNSSTKDLSIIIPTFNNVEFIDDCLSSILKSVKDLNCEILIGIDSCVKTLNHVKNKVFDSRIKFRFFDKKFGPYVIRNSLASISNSENLLFFDSDDLMLENMIPDVIYSLSKYSLYKPMYNDIKNNDNISTFITKRTNTYGEGVFGIKKDLFMSVNGFEPWPCAADSDFMARIYSKKISLNASRDAVFLRRIHPNSLTSNPETNYSSKTRAYYYGLSKRKRPKGIVCETLYISNSTEVTIYYRDEKLEKFEEQKNKIDNLVQNLNINPVKREINYDKINQVIEKKGVYNPNSSKKPIRENTPNKRQELIDLKKGSVREQVNKTLPGKPNRRNNLPNIF